MFIANNLSCNLFNRGIYEYINRTAVEEYTVSWQTEATSGYPSNILVTLPKEPKSLLVLYFDDITLNHNRGCVYYDVNSQISRGIGYSTDTTQSGTYRATYSITSISNNVATVYCSKQFAGTASPSGTVYAAIV